MGMSEQNRVAGVATFILLMSSLCLLATPRPERRRVRTSDDHPMGADRVFCEGIPTVRQWLVLPAPK